jgi:hypothetical protein
MTSSLGVAISGNELKPDKGGERIWNKRESRYQYIRWMPSKSTCLNPERRLLEFT